MIKKPINKHKFQKGSVYSLKTLVYESKRLQTNLAVGFIFFPSFFYIYLYFFSK